MKSPVCAAMAASQSEAAGAGVRGALALEYLVTLNEQKGLNPDGINVIRGFDGNLKVYGIDNLRIADGSIMPRVTTGNTMAPCVIIGERAAEVLRTQHKLDKLRQH